MICETKGSNFLFMGISFQKNFYNRFSVVTKKPWFNSVFIVVKVL